MRNLARLSGRQLGAKGGVIVAFALVAAACGDGSLAETTIAAATTITGASVEATTTTAEVTTTTGASVEATTTTADDHAAFTETSDMVYMTMDGVELLMDVYVPAGEGPWPVVVAFHELDSDGKDAREMTPLIEAAAAEGLVIFAPSWIVWNPGPFPFTIEVFEGWKQAANCAVAFAQQNAASYGGDPANTVVYGFSAGAGAALLASVQPSTDPISGCETDVSPTSITGAVLGDGEYFLHSDNFDVAFEADLDAMQAEVASLTDATYWPADLEAKFFLWVADSGTSPRGFGDSSDESGWLAKRDPDGSIRTDLERLSQLEDGTINFIDAGQLLELRLSEAGIEVTLDEYPGGHTTLNKMRELIGYLKAAAAR